MPVYRGGAKPQEPVIAMFDVYECGECGEVVSLVNVAAHEAKHGATR